MGESGKLARTELAVELAAVMDHCGMSMGELLNLSNEELLVTRIAVGQYRREQSQAAKQEAGGHGL